ncbi:hypothetical protein K7432_009992 [Basidiobolus ranarum]|uniref:Uncharacterized protein n=1 Tax=Basidiobolus ranarum TaxID=34480 RepID=A0ABR2WPC8_9FUNG
MSSDFDYLTFLRKRCQHDTELMNAPKKESDTEDKSLDFKDDIKHCNNPELVDEIRAKLLNSIEGMFYISEADYPFTFFFIPSSKISEKGLSTSKVLSVEEFRQVINLDTPLADSQISLEEFFQPFEDSSEYQSLEKTFRQFFEPDHLSIYRLGEIEISVWITGLIEDVGLIGVSTLSIES